jgi:hypothetical protein
MEDSTHTSGSFRKCDKSTVIITKKISLTQYPTIGQYSPDCAKNFKKVGGELNPFFWF